MMMHIKASLQEQAVAAAAMGQCWPPRCLQMRVRRFGSWTRVVDVMVAWRLEARNRVKIRLLSVQGTSRFSLKLSPGSEICSGNS
jgi:hypothetical protein